MQINTGGRLLVSSKEFPLQKQERETQKQDLGVRDSYILEGKSVEAVYAFVTTEWAYVYMNL